MGTDRRAGMTVRVVPLRSPEASMPPAPASAEERLALVAELSEWAWRLGGRPFPSASRAEMTATVRPMRELGDQSGS